MYISFNRMYDWTTNHNSKFPSFVCLCCILSHVLAYTGYRKSRNVVLHSLKHSSHSILAPWFSLMSSPPSTHLLFKWKWSLKEKRELPSKISPILLVVTELGGWGRWRRRWKASHYSQVMAFWGPSLQVGSLMWPISNNYKPEHCEGQYKLDKANTYLLSLFANFKTRVALPTSRWCHVQCQTDGITGIFSM